MKETYTPHIIIGKNKSIEETESIHNMASNLLTSKFNVQIQFINSKILVRDSEGNVSLEKKKWNTTYLEKETKHFKQYKFSL